MKKIPGFKSPDKERKFWEKADSLEYIDWKRAKKVTLPDLKSSVRTISLRIPESLLHKIKLVANRRGVAYKTIIKIFLYERIEKELK